MGKLRKALRADVSAEPTVERERPPMRARRRAVAVERPESAPESTPKKDGKGEPDSVAKARRRLRGLLNQVVGDADAVSIGLVLAILTQETGNNAAANALIEEHKLEKLFGLRPKKLRR